MIAVDTSVVVAGFASWHEHHETARGALDTGPSLPSHAALESYSVLTRLPHGLRVSPSLVVEFLADTFPEPSLVIPATVARHIPARLSDIGIEGGAVWDALIAITAAAHDATLLTFDARAARAYARCGVEAELLA